MPTTGSSLSRIRNATFPPPTGRDAVTDTSRPWARATPSSVSRSCGVTTTLCSIVDIPSASSPLPVSVVSNRRSEHSVPARGPLRHVVYGASRQRDDERGGGGHAVAESATLERDGHERQVCDEGGPTDPVGVGLDGGDGRARGRGGGHGFLLM